MVLSWFVCACVVSAQNHGTTSCSVDSASDRNDRPIETELGIYGTGETTSGSPQDGRADAGGASRTETSVRNTSLAGGTRAVRAQEAPAADDARWTIRIWSVCGEVPNRELQWRRHWMARLVPGVSYFGRTVLTVTSTRNHQSSGGTIWR